MVRKVVCAFMCGVMPCYLATCNWWEPYYHRTRFSAAAAKNTHWAATMKPTLNGGGRPRVASPDSTAAATTRSLRAECADWRSTGSGSPGRMSSGLAGVAEPRGGSGRIQMGVSRRLDFVGPGRLRPSIVVVVTGIFSFLAPLAPALLVLSVILVEGVPPAPGVRQRILVSPVRVLGERRVRHQHEAGLLARGPQVGGELRAEGRTERGVEGGEDHDANTGGEREQEEADARGPRDASPPPRHGCHAARRGTPGGRASTRALRGRRWRWRSMRRRGGLHTPSVAPRSQRQVLRDILRSLAS